MGELRSDLPANEIRAQLRRIQNSQGFSSAKRLRDFLGFVVQEKLAGREDRIKALTIAQDVFDRGADFDPQSDTIVRVEAGRLRGRLTEYYATEGIDDPVLIQIPKGKYVPSFSLRSLAPPTSATSDASEVWRPGAPWRSLALAVLVVLVGLAIWSFGRETDPAGTAQLTDPGGTAIAQKVPFVIVLPLNALSDDPIDQRIADGLVEAIITDLTKVSGLSVLAHASTLQLERHPLSLNDYRDNFGATHLLRGSLARENGKVRVNAQLVEIASGKTLWADQITAGTNSLFDLEDFLAEQITTSLSVLVSVDERQRRRNRHTENVEALVLYRQALELANPPTDPTRLLSSRRLFRHVVDLDPEFAGGYAGQAYILALAVVFGLSAEPEKDLKNARALAQRAIEADKDFGMGYASLAFAECLSGLTDSCLENAKMAVTFQPGDAYSHWLFGINLILSRQPAAAVAELEKAIQLDPVEVRRPYLNVLSMAHFAAADYSKSLEIIERNLARGGPPGPHMDLFRAAALVELGKPKQAQIVISQMLNTYNGFSAELWMRWWFTSQDYERVMADLYASGLPKPELLK